jgi:RNA polymerase sigma-70 factor (ECF subfamily)
MATSALSSVDLFEILVRENIDMLRAFLLGSVRDASTADELVQETFVVAWRNLERYDRSLPFGPWVRGIAKNLVLNHRRRIGRSKLYFCDQETLQALDDRFEQFLSVSGDTFDEKLDALRDCLRGLPDSQRTAIALHYERGLQCKEIARRTGAGVEAVKKHLQRGRAALMECIESRIGAGDAA